MCHLWNLVIPQAFYSINKMRDDTISPRNWRPKSTPPPRMYIMSFSLSMRGNLFLTDIHRLIWSMVPGESPWFCGALGLNLGGHYWKVNWPLQASVNTWEETGCESQTNHKPKKRKLLFISLSLHSVNKECSFQLVGQRQNGRRQWKFPF